jgi:hypothetical protein
MHFLSPVLQNSMDEAVAAEYKKEEKSAKATTDGRLTFVLK